MSRIVGSALLFGALLSAAGCTTILGGFDFDGPGAGGAGGTSSTTSSTASGGGGTGGTSTSTASGGGGTGGSSTTSTACAAICELDTDCTAPHQECEKWICDTTKCCALEPLPNGASPPGYTPVPGDCKITQCDGTSGAPAVLVDPSDTPPASDECHAGVCTGGTPGQSAIQPNPNTCTMQGGGSGVCSDPSGTTPGVCVTCNVGMDCPASSTLCAAPICTGTNICSTSNASPGSGCTDSGGKVCDGSGKCVQCLQPSDCTSPSTPMCNAAHVCVPAGCNDGQKNGSETGVDCGGGVCPKCPAGEGCSSVGDCESGVCNLTCQAPTCSDGVLNGVESDADCGGGCATCADGKLCKLPSDCSSGLCSSGGQCISCTDTVRNGTETDVDCGGPACPKCDLGESCSLPSDCESGLCSSGGQCISCTDTLQNGTETDIDCGGPTCPKCDLGEGCQVAGDCASGICAGGVCGVCQPGAKQCSGNGVQTCSATGTWSAATACEAAAPVCCQGACTATVAQAASAESHGCLVKTNGTIWCWGNNSFGQIGNGTAGQSELPFTQVTGVADATTVVAGRLHTCTLRTGGTVWCWGDNSAGQLGNGTNVQSNVPVRVGTATVTLDSVVQLSSRYYHTCAVKTNGTLWCWGNNSSGQLANNGAGAHAKVPVQAAASTMFQNLFAQVAAGNGHTCARLTTGAAWCWGNNNDGQLGNGTVSGVGPFQVTGAGTVADISAGTTHSCATRDDAAHTAWCWGRNASGQLGDGTITTQPSPVQVLSPLGMAKIMAGENSTCGITTAGTLFCWGNNNYGEVGDGTLINRLTPTPVALLGGAIAKANAGAGSNSAVLNDGTFWNWGFNASNLLADGSQFPARPRPKRQPIGVCSTDPCNNAKKDGTETAIDCGGSCATAYGLVCADNKACTTAADCNGISVCQASICTSMCFDGVTDGSESDVDCGNFFCGLCGIGSHCNSAANCAGGMCESNICCGPPNALCALPSDCCSNVCSAQGTCN